MADMVQSALRRKLAAAQAVGDVHRISILRGMMASDAAEEVRTEVAAPEEAPAPVVEIIEPPTTTRPSWSGSVIGFGDE